MLSKKILLTENGCFPFSNYGSSFFSLFVPSLHVVISLGNVLKQSALRPLAHYVFFSFCLFN